MITSFWVAITGFENVLLNDLILEYDIADSTFKNCEIEYIYAKKRGLVFSENAFVNCSGVYSIECLTEYYPYFLKQFADDQCYIQVVDEN